MYDVRFLTEGVRVRLEKSTVFEWTVYVDDSVFNLRGYRLGFVASIVFLSLFVVCPFLVAGWQLKIVNNLSKREENDENPS